MLPVRDRELCDPLTQRIVGVGVEHHLPHSLQHFRDRQRRIPAVVENVQANCPAFGDIAVENRGLELDVRRLERVLVRDCDIQHERPSLERSPRRPFDQRSHQMHVVCVGEEMAPGAALALGHLAQLLHDSPHRMRISRRRRWFLQQGSKTLHLLRLHHVRNVRSRSIVAALYLDSLGRAEQFCNLLVGRWRLELHRLVCIPAPSPQAHHRLGLHQLETIAQRVDLVAFAARCRHDFQEIGIGSVADDDCVNHGPDRGYRFQSVLWRCSCVVLPVGEHEDAQVCLRSFFEDRCQHAGCLDDAGVNGGSSTVFHVVDDRLELIEFVRQLQQHFEIVVELHQPELVHALRAQ
mmetsp:Transcript_28707/g.68063  ORF Transcript_28707/g.68063 Transcript_28707/m.68063 type:complete len:350 (+) Transcript_28707:257-1306(+)